MDITAGGRISQNFLLIFKGVSQLIIYITGFSCTGKKTVTVLINGELM
jgi:adenylylsulfate kinase-like enzyme